MKYDETKNKFKSLRKQNFYCLFWKTKSNFFKERWNSLAVCWIYDQQNFFHEIPVEY